MLYPYSLTALLICVWLTSSFPEIQSTAPPVSSPVRSLHLRKLGKRILVLPERVTQMSQYLRHLDQHQRLADLDVVICRLYEDSVLGNLSMERYKKMSADYESEQERLKLEFFVAEEWVGKQEEMHDGLDAFIALTQKYVDVAELTPTIVNEYSTKIVVHALDKSSGKRKQKVKIYLNRWCCPKLLTQSPITPAACGCRSFPCGGRTPPGWAMTMPRTGGRSSRPTLWRWQRS